MDAINQANEFSAKPEAVRLVADFVGRHYKSASVAARRRSDWIVENRSGANRPRYRVFMYWAQGFDSAPPVVKACYNRLRKFHTDADCAFIDDKNFHHFIDVPDTIKAEVLENKTFFSDFLRFEILSRYGGVWADATCLASGDWIDATKKLIAPQGFFAFPKSKEGLISSWFLASEPGNYVACLMRELLTLYCSERPGPDHYFAMHQIFKECFKKDPHFQLIASAIRPGKFKPRDMNRKMLKTVHQPEFNELLGGSFVHKLSWKHKPEQINSKALIAAVVRGDWFTDPVASLPKSEGAKVKATPAAPPKPVPGEILLNPATGVKLRYDAELMTEAQAIRVKTGRFESKEIQAAFSVLNGGERILELGGGFGIVSSTICAKKSPESYDIIEANPALIPAIQDAHKLNRITIAKVHNCIATSDPDALARGYYEFNIGKSLLGSSILDTGKTKSTIRVDALPIQKFLDDIQPQVIVCDIEGAELGLFATVSMKSVNLIIMETHPGFFGTAGMKTLFNELSDQGFAYEPSGSNGPVVTFRRADANKDVG